MNINSQPTPDTTVTPDTNEPVAEKPSIHPDHAEWAKNNVDYYGDPKLALQSVVSHPTSSPEDEQEKIGMLKALVQNHGIDPKMIPAAYKLSVLGDDASDPEEVVDTAPIQIDSSKPLSKKLKPEEALSLAAGILSGVGIDVNGLDGKKKVQIVDAVQDAMQSDSDFGIMYAMEQFKKNKTLSDDHVDVLGIDILNQLKSQGKLIDNPNAFKDYLKPDKFLEKFIPANPSLANMTPEQSKHLYDTIQAGLSITDDPNYVKGSTTPGQMGGYQKSKIFYQKELGDKYPQLFTPEVLSSLRNGLMQYHDEKKKIVTFLADKAAAIKKEAEDAKKVQEALAALQKGGGAENIIGVVSTLGIKDPNMVQKIAVTLHQALQAPTSQLMLDKIAELVGNADGAYGGNINMKAANLTSDQYKALRSVAAASYFDKNSKPLTYTEPPVNETPQQRANHVFDKMTQQFGFTLSHVPDNSGYYSTGSERQTLVTAVQQALATPDKNKVNSILNSLFVTGTSLNDAQINQLRQLVHQERANPASKEAGYAPIQQPAYSKVTPASTSAPVAASPTAKSSAPDISNEPEYIQKSKYYSLPTTNKKEIHDAIFDVMASSKLGLYNQKSYANNLTYKLTGLGLPQETARKVALWAVRDALKGTPLALKAKAKAAANVSSSSSVNTSVPMGSSQQDAQKFVASLDPSKDINKVVTRQMVQGEEIRIGPMQLEGGKNSTHAVESEVQAERKAQIEFQKKNRTPEDRARFSAGLSSWLSGGQWHKSPQQRKALNEIMTRMIEGPPPQYTNVKTYVERGMNMHVKDFEQYIKAFKVGEPTYIGPSGFSANSSTAKNFGGLEGSVSSEHVPVLIRVKPDKNGRMKAVRNNTGGFPSEQELILGTNKQFRTTKVIKHVIPDGTGKYYCRYEIELEFDESIVESKMLREGLGFDMNLWKGLSKETIAALIKYNNSSVGANRGK